MKQIFKLLISLQILLHLTQQLDETTSDQSQKHTLMDCFSEEQRTHLVNFIIESNFTTLLQKRKLNIEQFKRFLIHDILLTKNIVKHLEEMLQKLKNKDIIELTKNIIDEFNQKGKNFDFGQNVFSNEIFQFYNDHITKIYKELNEIQFLVALSPILIGRQQAFQKILNDQNIKISREDENDDFILNYIKQNSQMFFYYEDALNKLLNDNIFKYEVYPLYMQLVGLEIINYEYAVFNNGMLADFKYNQNDEL